MRFLLATTGPDSEAAIARAFPRPVNRVAHPHGRAVLVGEWNEAQRVTVTSGERSLTLLGTTAVTTDELERELRRYRTAGDVEGIHRRIPGSYFTVLAWEHETIAFGTFSGIRQLVYSTGASLVSNDAAVLRDAINAGLDDATLPLFLISLKPPAVLGDRTAWLGIRAVPPTYSARLTGNGEFGIHPRWVPPTAEGRLEDIAPLLTQALDDAVRARQARGRISTDLSGGMDSTTLAFFAHRRRADLITMFRPALDSSNDDQRWTSAAEEHLPGAHHLRLPAEQSAPWFSDWLDQRDGNLEGPLPSSRVGSYLRELGRLVAEAGSTTHLTGIGGDELFHPSFALVQSLAFRRPKWAWEAARRAQAMGRWSTGATLAALYRRESLSAWLRRSAAEIDRLPAVQGAPSSDWEPRPLLPPWASALTIDATRESIRAAADVATTELDPVDYEMLSLASLSGSLVRRFEPLLASHGVSYEAPFLDDNVIEIAMSIQRSDRARDGAYKPVLAAAARPVVPASLLGRRTKGDYSREAYDGIRKSRDQILHEFESSELAARGLIDTSALRRTLTGVNPDTRAFQFLDPTLTTEAWLRVSRTAALT